MMLRLLLLLSFAASLLQCASGPRQQLPVEQKIERIPVGLIVEQVISGELLKLTLADPTGLVADRYGSVYLADAGNNRVIRFDSALIPRSDTRGYGSHEGALDRPSFLCYDNNLSLIVADAGNRRLVWFDRQLHFADELPLLDEEDALKYGEVVSVATTAYGELWAVDWELGRIIIFDNGGDFISFVGDFGSPGGQLSRPEKIIINSAPGEDGFVVCDAGNSRLVYYDSYGNYLSDQLDDLFEYPVAMTLVPDGMWVLDGQSGRVIFADKNRIGQFVTGPVLAGSRIALKEPTDILSLADGRLLIADSGNNRLLVLRPYFE